MKKLLSALALTTICVMSTNISAHERFMVPTHTLLSGDKAQAVTVTASISNDIFHPDRPLGDSNTGASVGNLKSLFDLLEHSVIFPDGKQTTDTRWQAFARMSVADVEIKQSGTYRISLVQPDVHMTTFAKADGSFGRVFGKGAKLPSGIKNVVRRTTNSRVETFVSLNEPNQAAQQPTGKGLEIMGAEGTHPNDLFAGEAANFSLYYQGKPLTLPAKVKIIRAGTRHRNDRNEQQLAVENGKFSFTPEQAGFYFVTAETHKKLKQPSEVDVKHFSLYLTLEVFPQ